MSPIDKPYFGGKSQHGVYQTIINLIPPHRVFVSAFLGHCGVLRRIKAPDHVVGFDLDQQVVNGWTRLYGHWRFNRASFLDALDENGSFRNGYGLLTSGGTASGRRVFIFADPPYPKATRTSNHRYKYELTDMEHGVLVNKVKNTPFNCMLCSYPNAMYDTALAGWNKFDYVSTDRARKPRTTRLYYNYPTPVELHDYRYIGKDYRQREIIQRKLKSLKGKFNRLPEQQRHAFLSLIQQ